MIPISVSLNIILHELKIPCEEHTAPLQSNPGFQAVELLSTETQKNPSVLYIGTLSQALSQAARSPDSFFLAIRDRFPDQEEEPCRNLIILRANMEIAELYNRVMRIFLKILHWNYEMSCSAAAAKGLQDLLNLSEDILENHIDIQDSAFSLLAYTKNIPIDDEITNSLVEKGYHDTKTIRQFQELRRIEEFHKQSQVYISNDHKLCKYSTVKRVLHLNNKIVLYIVMHCNHREVDDGLIDLFQMLVSYASCYVLKNSSYPVHFQSYSQYFADLLDGKIKNKDEAVSRAAGAGLLFQGRFLLAIIQFDDIFNTPVENLTMQLRQHLTACYVFSYQNHIILVSPVQKNCKDSHRQLLDNLKPLLTAKCLIGISNIFTDLWELKGAHEQAGCAVEYGFHVRKKNADNSEMNAFTFEESFLTLIISKSFNSSPDLFRSCFMTKAIEKLKKDDSMNSHNMIQLLSIYLASGCKATKTSELLHMHRNTVLYHIERIEQLLGISLSDMEVRTKLYLGLAAENSGMSEFFPL